MNARNITTFIVFLLVASGTWYLARSLNSTEPTEAISNGAMEGFYLKSARILGTDIEGQQQEGRRRQDRQNHAERGERDEEPADTEQDPARDRIGRDAHTFKRSATQSSAPLAYVPADPMKRSGCGFSIVAEDKIPATCR